MAQDLVDKIIRYEGGEMDDDETVEFFQQLINNGMAWSLQGHYGRTARYLIDRGLCKEKKRKLGKGILNG